MHVHTRQRPSRHPSTARIEPLECRQLLSAAVTGLTLVNADTNRVIETLEHGDTIDLARAGARLSIRAAAVEAESVRFNYDGDPGYRVDSSAPYSIGGERRGGLRDQAWTPTVGTHTLVVTTYAEDGGAGAPGESRMLVFNVIDSRGNPGRRYAPPMRGGVSVRRPAARASAPAAPGPLYVNAGGGTFADSLGRVFQGDTGFSGGFTGSSGVDVASLVLYQSYRGGEQFTFSHPVADGQYTLWLHFVEPTATQVGERQLDVTVEGALVLDDYDVLSKVGGRNVPTAEAFDVRVTDNRLDLGFSGVAGEAIVSGITLIPTDVPAAVKPYSWSCFSDAEAQFRSATHLRLLGLSLMHYSNSNKGRYPAELAELAGDTQVELFANPRAGTLVPRGEMSPVEQYTWASTLDDYVYVGAGKHSGFPAEVVIAYENPDRVWGDVHVLFNDGHVERLSRVDAAALIGFPGAPPTNAPLPRDPATEPSCVRDPHVVGSRSNLIDLARALFNYANDNKGTYPSDPGTVFDTGGMELATFVNPRGDMELPVGLRHEEQMAWVNAATDYVYLGRRKRASMDGDVVLAFENPAEMRDGINILFNDGRVEFREMRWAIETLRRAGVAGVA